MQACRDCGRMFPYDEQADYCPTCILINTGDVQAADAFVLRQPGKYLGGATREKIAAWLVEYRRFIAAHPDDPLVQLLAECIADARLALRQRRAVNRLTGLAR
jgi:hypothetical protein